MQVTSARKASCYCWVGPRTSGDSGAALGGSGYY